jgi:hypothetical protein
MFHVHPDNHVHPRMQRVVARLLEAARDGHIYLVYEGIEFTAADSCTVESHDISTTLPTSQLQGIEGRVTGPMEWATAYRYVRGQSRVFRGLTLSEIPGDSAKQTIRQVALALAWLGKEKREQIRVPEDLERFVQRIDRTGSLSERQNAANQAAVQAGRWPGKHLTLQVLEDLMVASMPFMGLGGEASSQMNRILYTEREAIWASNLSRLETNLPIHIVVGVGHLGGMVSDRMVAELGFDVGEFRAHQATISGPRLWNVVDMILPDDPFRIEMFERRADDMHREKLERQLS